MQPTPASSGHCHFFERALARSAQGVCEVLNEELVEMEKRLVQCEENTTKTAQKAQEAENACKLVAASHAQSAQELHERAEAIEAAQRSTVAQVVEHNKMLQALTAKMASFELQAAAASPGAPSSASSNSATPQRVHPLPSGAVRQERSEQEQELMSRTATMGNLGWDEEADVLKARAVEVLQTAGASDAYESIVARTSRQTRTGSMAEIVFKSESLLWQTKVKVNAMTKIFPNARNPAWVDRRKSREELAPSRMLNALMSCCQDLEQKQEQPRVVERSNLGRCIKVGGIRFVAVSERGEITVGSQASDRYGAAAVQDLIGWGQSAR